MFNFIHYGMSLQLVNNQFARLDGKLYSGNLSEIQYKIEFALDRTQSLTIDLNALENFDIAGIYMLYITTKKARENNKEVVLCCSQNEFLKIAFSILGIHYSDSLPIKYH